MSKVDNDDGGAEFLQKLLLKQYQHVEEYCNAQTRLQNALMDNRSTSQHKWETILHRHTLQQSTLDLNESIQRVKSDLIEIEKQIMLQEDGSNSFLDRNVREALEQHMKRSRRVVQTIFGSGGQLHTCGIPVNGGNQDHDIKIIALASLRASRAQLNSYLNRAM
mmetsp:Transcript_9803/g.13811  ORF Transcript_9803/g.13811 Transcript_9803/m.13811 type:complete len:164 (+) Transcript_9803:55-546(+)